MRAGAGADHCFIPRALFGVWSIEAISKGLLSSVLRAMKTQRKGMNPANH